MEICPRQFNLEGIIYTHKVGSPWAMFYLPMGKIASVTAPIVFRRTMTVSTDQRQQPWLGSGAP